MELFLIGDLVRVISIYSTTNVTFDLLTFDSPISMTVYGPAVWRAKAIYESRGLIVDEKIIAGRWFEYYLMRNRTFYGKLAEIMPTGRVDVLANFPILYAIIGPIYAIVQLPDFSIALWAGRYTDTVPPTKRIPYNFRLIAHNFHEFLDERGTIGK